MSWLKLFVIKFFRNFVSLIIKDYARTNETKDIFLSVSSKDFKILHGRSNGKKLNLGFLFKPKSSFEPFESAFVHVLKNLIYYGN